MEPPARSPPRPREEAAEIDFDDEEEDPEELEQWVTSSSDSEPEREPNRPPLEPAPPPPPTPSPAPAWAEPPEQQPAPVMEAVAEAEKKGDGAEDARPRWRWPGWPGDSVFRLVVPADKVGGVIGRRGETIRRLCVETRARVRVLDAPLGAACQIVLVSAKEEVEAEVSPAMKAAIKIFKHINDIEEINSDGTLSASAPEICSVRLLVPFVQAVHLIGKQGATIKAIQGSTGATIKIIDEGIIFCNNDTCADLQHFGFHITRTMQVPLSYAEEIIGVRGENIEFICSVSGAVVVLEEIGDYHEVQVMIEGTPS